MDQCTEHSTGEYLTLLDIYAKSHHPVSPVLDDSNLQSLRHSKFATNSIIKPLAEARKLINCINYNNSRNNYDAVLPSNIWMG